MARALAEQWVLRAQALARIEAGASVEDACAGLTGPWNLRRWARQNASFREEYRRALSMGRWRRTYGYDPAVAEAFLARARAGEPVNALIGQPGMPSRTAYRYWKMTQIPFCAAVGALRERRDGALGERAVGRRRDWDPDAADAIMGRLGKVGSLEAVLAADPALPGRETVRRWRAEQPEFDMVLTTFQAAWRRKHAADRLYRPKVVEAVVERLLMGELLNQIGGRAGRGGRGRRPKGMPCRATLYRWVATRPAFAERVARACADREHWYHDQLDMIEAEAVPGMPMRDLRAIWRRTKPITRRLGQLKRRPGPRAR